MKFYDYLVQIKNNGQFNHSLIISSTNCIDHLALSKMYLKTLICKHKIPFCDQCDYCHKINNDAYVDFIYLENNLEHKISKEDILLIQERFIKPATEATDIKLYSISNIDQTNKQTINALLKFIEDYPSNTFNLFFCTNHAKIIDTILSRSNLVIIDDKLILEDNNYDNDLINNVFSDYSQYQAFINEYDFNQLIKYVQLLISIKQEVEQISIIKQLSNLSRYEFDIFLHILVYYLNDEQKQLVLTMINDLKLNMNQKNMLILILQIINKH